MRLRPGSDLYTLVHDAKQFQHHFWMDRAALAGRDALYVDSKLRPQVMDVLPKLFERVVPLPAVPGYPVVWDCRGFRGLPNGTSCGMLHPDGRMPGGR